MLRPVRGICGFILMAGAEVLHVEFLTTAPGTLNVDNVYFRQ
ncbi:hypothetical protein [Pyxidicoccus xibeiensis]|nr:hypothetical protein [Pyxidicoccus xibeiensis]